MIALLKVLCSLFAWWFFWLVVLPLIHMHISLPPRKRDDKHNETQDSD